MRDDETREGTTTTEPRHALDPERGDAIDPDRADPPTDMDRDTDETPRSEDAPADWPPGVERSEGAGELPPPDRQDDTAVGVAEAPPGAIPDERPRDSVSPGPLDEEAPPSGAGFRGPVPGSPASGPLDGTGPDSTEARTETAPSGTAPEASTDTAPASAAEVPDTGATKPTETDRLFATDQASDFHNRWHEVQASFVDDPTTAVRSADQLIGEVVSALITTLQDRQRTLGEAWQDVPESATEEMRTALVRYRAVFQRIIEL